jgi:hypothetical protein
MVLQHGGSFQFVVSNALVFRDQYPTLLPDKWQPYRVFRSGRKVLPVAFVLHAMLHKSIENRFAVVKIFVKVKNEVFRQRQPLSSAPSGLLLRSAAA